MRDGKKEYEICKEASLWGWMQCLEEQYPLTQTTGDKK